VTSTVILVGVGDYTVIEHLLLYPSSCMILASIFHWHHFSGGRASQSDGWFMILRFNQKLSVFSYEQVSGENLNQYLDGTQRRWYHRRFPSLTYSCHRHHLITAAEATLYPRI
jgi:hypothetical protein